MKTTERQLVCFHANGLFAVEKDKPLPTEFRICPWNKVETQKGQIGCGNVTSALMMSNQKAANRERVALDFEHNTVPGSKTYKGEPAKVAAWGSIELRPGDGVYLCSAEWTPEGEEHVRGGHAKGISPAAILSDDGEVVFMHSAGLCRHQEIAGLTLFSAGDDLRQILISAKQTKPEDDMDITAVRNLCNVFLGSAGLPLIPETAKAEDIERLAGEGADKIKAAMNRAPEKGKEVETFNADLAGLRKELDGLRKERIMDGAIRDGKIVAFTAEEIEKMDVKTFEAHVGKLEAGKVPLDKRTPDGLKTFSADGGLSAADREVMKAMGLTEAEWKKHNG